jgi:3-deoxy-D-manno-octulosonic-acid transferase
LIIVFADTVVKRGSSRNVVQSVVMALYSLLLMAVLVVGAPYWLARMVNSGRYRTGIWQRLGRVPAQLRAAAAGRQVVWIHAVSVGEVLAATRLVAELETALGPGWIIVVSTTTATGQALAQQRFGGENADRVFYYPLDFAWAVRAYLRALHPRLLVLMESELWPRMLVECGRRGIPVAVVNARVSDRSFARGMRLHAVWGHVLRVVTLFLAQSEEDARRLGALGARPNAVRAIGNLKYDVRAPQASRVAEWIRVEAGPRPVIVAGSTLGGEDGREEEIALAAWKRTLGTKLDPALVLAPRHPERFSGVEAVLAVLTHERYARASDFGPPRSGNGFLDIILLDTIGDLAAVYGVADVAFVGGSLVPRGGHNPLEPARFGVPVLMGPSYENFRDIVAKMQAADAIRIVKDKDDLEAALIELLTDREAARAMGERGRQVFEQQQGATARAVEALLRLVKP